MKDLHDQHVNELTLAQTKHNDAISKAMNELTGALDAANNAYADALHASRVKLQDAMSRRLSIWRGEDCPHPTTDEVEPSVKEANIREFEFILYDNKEAAE